MPDQKPTTEGTFLKTPFANVLLYAREKKMSGTLVVTIEPTDSLRREQVDVAGQSTVVLEEGQVVAVSLPRTVDTLPWVLRDLGFITEAVFVEVQAALEATGAEEVSTLMRLRACSPMTLDKALREQTRRKVLALFNYPEGTYAYYARADLLNGAERVRTPEDLLPIVWRAFALCPPDASTLDPVLSRIGNRSVRLREGHEFDRFEFGEETGLAATQLRVAPAAIEQLVGLGSSPGVVRAMIYLLALTRQLEVVAQAAPVVTPPVVPVHLPSPGPLPAALPAAPPATPPLPPVPASARLSPLPVVAAREPVTEPEEIDGEDLVSEEATQPAALKESDESKLLTARRHLHELEQKTYFEMFSVTFTVSSADVRAAFPRVASQWHPDRVATAALKAVYTEIFSHYSTAHSTLTEPRIREQYEGSLSGGGGTPAAHKTVAAVLDTVHDSHRAEMAVKRKDFAEADRLLRKVIAASPDDLPAQLMHASVLFETDANANVDEAIQLTANVIKNSEQNDKAFSLMGALLKHKGDRRYVAFYRQALSSNPQNLEASREVRLYELRAMQRREQNTAQGRITGFFNKLLKK